eukprot:TRINITY_DN22950_c0_g1_i2.p1 TRINITY_DN22950_c0_g1~~TRINITY_DN22950_c0_g1_i2.p1  ORF type:complete len:243 (+),score=81.53 TRINITY_DN22950_c0_g1_i2:125-853(+)
MGHGSVAADTRSVRSAGSRRSKRSGRSRGGGSGGSGKSRLGALGSLRLQYDEEQRRLRELTEAVGEFQEEIDALQESVLGEAEQQHDLEEDLRQQLHEEEAGLSELRAISAERRAALREQRSELREARQAYFMACVQFAYNFIPTRGADPYDVGGSFEAAAIEGSPGGAAELLEGGGGSPRRLAAPLIEGAAELAPPLALCPAPPQRGPAPGESAGSRPPLRPAPPERAAAAPRGASAPGGR